jgi:hypothetical protein
MNKILLALFAIPMLAVVMVYGPHLEGADSAVPPTYQPSFETVLVTPSPTYTPTPTATFTPTPTP